MVTGSRAVTGRDNGRFHAPLYSVADERHTDKERYNTIANDLKGLGRRMVIGGMHVHVGIEGDDQRIAMMNEIRPYLPLLLALSTSSRSGRASITGLKS